MNHLLAKSPDERFGSAANVAQIPEHCVAHVQQPNVTALTEIPSEEGPINRCSRFLCAEPGLELSPDAVLLTSRQEVRIE